MRQPVVLCSSLLISLAFAGSAGAATLYTSPTGTATTGCARDMPCDIKSVAAVAVPGDTVILLDGIYKDGLSIPDKTGSSSSAWITFQADDCALPIIEGPGVGPTSNNEDSGVYAKTATYLRFIGIVSRGWNIGFNNGWTGKGNPSNGNFEYKYCIADSNGRSGFSHFSAQGLHLQNSIAAHNGSSTAESWSSGVTLYEVTGNGNLVEGNISFENMDAHTPTAETPGTHSDGNGFIVDEGANGATFINNIAFRNGGSCLRLTRSSNTRFINNTCYHNAQDPQAQGPSNPSEVYFTDATSKNGVSFLNNVFVATGTGPGKDAVYGQPTSGWSNNIVATGSVSHFTAAEGTNPDFTLASGATTLIGKGGTGSGVPTNDVGFDPKCITKKPPTKIGMMAQGSWWQHSIDYDYIKSIGGVAKCFNPASRSGTPDIGAYKNGAVTKAPVCTPTGTGGSTGMGGTGGGGAAGSAGAANKGGGGGVGGTTSTAGSTSSGGSTTTAGAGGNSSQAGNSSAGSSGGGLSGAGGATGGTTSSGVGGSAQPSGNGGAASGLGGSSASSGGSVAKGGGTSSSSGGSSTTDASGCGCRTAPQQSTSGALLGLGLLGLGMIGARRRRQSR